MAQTKNSKRGGTTRKTTTSRRKTSTGSGGKRVSRREQRRAKANHLIASLVLFGLGLLVCALLLVPGQEESGWHVLRGWLFGLFGSISILLGPILLYLGYLISSGYLVDTFIAKVSLMATLCASIPVVFSDFTAGDATPWQTVQLLFAHGQTKLWSGGLLGGAIGVPLVNVCGRPGANILMVLVFLIGLMIFFAVTPVDVVQFAAFYWQTLMTRIAQSRQYDEEEEEEEPETPPAPPERPRRKALPEPVSPAPRRRPAFSANPFVGDESTPAPVDPPAPEPQTPTVASRADFDIDLGPSVEQKALQNALAHDPLKPVVIGPGGTFGMDPLHIPVRRKEKTPPQQPETTEFDQHLDLAEPQPVESTTDELEGLFQKALAPMREEAAAQELSQTPVAEDEFDTVLEPVTDEAEVETPIPVVIEPEQPGTTYLPPTGAIPTLSGSMDPARAAWNAGVPLADVLTGALVEEPLPETPETEKAARHVATPRFRSRPAAPEAEPPAPEPQKQPSEPKKQPEEPKPQPAPVSKDPLPASEEAKPYVYPSLDLFNAARAEDEAGAEREMRHNADVLVNTLDSFGVKTRILDICRGPSVTRYELQPQAGIKVSRITSLADDIALNLATAGVRIEAPIPGKPAVGIEVPNKIRTTVSIRNVFESQNYINSRSPLTMALGKDIAGVAQVGDLCRMPHLLIAGSTGSGKSVCVNSIIISFLFRSSPEDVKLILIDPKVVELAEYNGIPHLLMPVVTEPRKAAGALGASVAEMERRYKLFADNNVREIKAYNKLAQSDPNMEHLPYIAIVIDELADLMMVSGKEVEDYICRIAQKARAAGIHLIVATQRPSVDVITGLIKANIPSRIAFAVSSQVDSRTILDGSGAEKLLGNGDMLFLPVGAAKPTRLQGTFVTDEEIAAVLNFIKATSDAQYDEEMIANVERLAIAEKGSKKDADGDDGNGSLDPAFEQAVECVIEAGQASTSMLQRRCKLGYARAARIMDQMEQEGIIGPYEGAKPRSVLVTQAQWQERKLSGHD